MKNLLAILTIILLSSMIHAQEGENTLAEKARIKGGFGAPFFVYSQVEDHNGSGGGGGGAVIINDLFFGGFGQGESFGEHVVNSLNYNLSLNQGGFWFGYAWPSRELVHGFGSFKLGFGEVTLNRNYRSGEPIVGDNLQDKVVAITPELGIEVNIVHWARLAVTAGYRWVDGVEKLPYFTDADFRSPVVGFTIRFGNFGYKKKE